MSNTFVLPPDFQPYLRPYRIGLRQHACVVLALLICIWVRVAKVVEFQDNFLTQLWTKICVKYFLLFPQENLPPEKTETNLWAFHPIFRFSFWLTKVTKNENITQQFFLSLFLSCLSCLANRKHCTKNQTGMLQAGGRGQIRRRPQIFRLCNMPVRQPIFVFGNFVNQNKKRKMGWKAEKCLLFNFWVIELTKTWKVWFNSICFTIFQESHHYSCQEIALKLYNIDWPNMNVCLTYMIYHRLHFRNLFSTLFM